MSVSDDILQVTPYHFLFKLIPFFALFFEDFQIGVIDSYLDISTGNGSKFNIYVSKSNLEC